MRLLGAGLLAAAGLWCGLLASRELDRELSRLRGLIRLTELMALELSRFQTPMPELFSGLAASLEGEAGRLCAGVAQGLARGESLEGLWRRETGALPPPERELLAPLGSVLGRYGAGEQAARAEAVRAGLEELWRERKSRLGERRRVRVSLCAGAGLMLAVLML